MYLELFKIRWVTSTCFMKVYNLRIRDFYLRFCSSMSNNSLSNKINLLILKFNNLKKFKETKQYFYQLNTIHVAKWKKLRYLNIF